MLLLAFFLPLMLTACVSRAVPVSGPQLPAIPTELSQRCADPGVHAGADARAELARNRAWGKCADRKHRDTTAFYVDVRRNLSGAR